MIGAAWTVLRKELRDALRDRRTLLTIVLSSVAVGPLVLLLLSTLVAGMEERAESREIVVAGIEHAPTLRNYPGASDLPHQRDAREQFEQQLQSKRLGEPVLVIPAGLRGRSGPWRNAARRTGAELGQPALAGWGVAPGPSAAGLCPGAGDAAPGLARRGAGRAAGHRGRRARPGQSGGAGRAVGHAGALLHADGRALRCLACRAGQQRPASASAARSNRCCSTRCRRWHWCWASGRQWRRWPCSLHLLSCASFLPGQWLLRSETLAAMFRFGVGEGAMFLALLLPLGRRACRRC